MVKERPSWDEYFMMVALLSSTRASCNYFSAGAVIVKDKRVIATGYNGAPQGILSCLDSGCRKDRMNVSHEEKNTGTCIGEHAERSALLQVSRDSTIGAAIYSLLLPCTDCSKQIVGAGIKKVVYLNAYEEPNNLVRELFDQAEIELKQIKLDLEKMYGFMTFARDRKLKK